jgi:hypothetical protein
LINFFVFFVFYFQHLDGFVRVVTILLQFIGEVKQIMMNLRLEIIGNTQKTIDLAFLQEVVEVINNQHKAI